MRLVLISLDAMFDADLPLMRKHEFFRDFLDHASGCTHTRTVYPALTYPAHTTLVTGMYPVRHKVGHNQPHNPGLDANLRPWYWDAKCVQTTSLFDAVKETGGRCASILWPVTGKSRAIKWNFPEVAALPGENQVLKMLRYGSPLWILNMERLHGAERKSIQQPHLSDYATILAEDVIAYHAPELTAVHLVDVDEMRHLHGVTSREARKGIARMSARAQVLWDTMQDTPAMEDAIFCLVSDHGQEDIHRVVDLDEKLSRLGVGGKFFVQSNGMGAYLYLRDPADEEHLEVLTAFLRENIDALEVAKVYDDADLRAIGAVSGVKLAVEALPGTMIADGLPQTAQEKATHGFGPGHPGENCLFMLRGKGIREGVWLPDMSLTDVAPTLAGLMGIPFPKADGRDLSGYFLKK